MRRAVVLAVALALSAGPALADPRPVTPAAPCYWVHGRLSVWNGAPSLRIWPVGTHRMLGVHDRFDGQLDSDYAWKTLPPELRDRKDWLDADFYGDYRVCPTTRQRPGHMQMVYVDKVRRLRVVPNRH